MASLQEHYLLYLLRSRIPPATSTDQDFEKWRDQLRLRTETLNSRVASMNAKIGVATEQVKQVEQLSGKFEKSLEFFDALFTENAVLRNLRDKWIPQIETTFHLKYPLVLALAMPPGGGTKRGGGGGGGTEQQQQGDKDGSSSSSQESDVADRDYLQVEMDNHRENIAAWTNSLLRYIQSLPGAAKFATRIEGTLEELKQLGVALKSIDTDLENFQKAKVEFVQRRAQMAQESRDMQTLEAQTAKLKVTYVKEDAYRKRAQRYLEEQQRGGDKDKHFEFERKGEGEEEGEEEEGEGEGESDEETGTTTTAIASSSPPLPSSSGDVQGDGARARDRDREPEKERSQQQKEDKRWEGGESGKGKTVSAAAAAVAASQRGMRTAANLSLYFDIATLKVLREKAQASVSSYRVFKTQWISRLRLVLYALIYELMEVELRRMGGYQTKFLSVSELYGNLKNVSEIKRSIMEMERGFYSEAQNIENNFKSMLSSFRTAIREYEDLIVKSKVVVERGKEELKRISRLQETRRWEWVKTFRAPAADFAMKLAETLGMEVTQGFRMKNVLENKDVVISEGCSSKRGTELKARKYQLLIGMLGNADIALPPLYVNHKMGSGKSLSFAEYLINYMFTASPERNGASRDCLILVPHPANVISWAGELTRRFAQRDFLVRYTYKLERHAKGTFFLIYDNDKSGGGGGGGKAKGGVSFLILITSFTEHLGDAKAITKRLRNRGGWSSLPDRGFKKADEKAFFSDTTEGMYPPDVAKPPAYRIGSGGGRPNQMGFWTPDKGLICVDEIQNIARPTDLTNRAQHNCYVWGFTVYITPCRKVALSATPALDYDRPSDGIKSIKVISSPATGPGSSSSSAGGFPSGVWPAPYSKSISQTQLKAIEDVEKASAQAETEFLKRELLDKPEKWKEYYPRLLISYINLENDPTSYPIPYNSCDFGDIKGRTGTEAMPTCQLLYNVAKENKTSKSFQIVLNKKVSGSGILSPVQGGYPFKIKYPLNAIPVIVSRVKPPAGGKTGTLLNLRRMIKFLVVHELIHQQPREKHFVFMNSTTFQNGPENSLVPLITKGLWKIPPYPPSAAAEFLTKEFARYSEKYLAALLLEFSELRTEFGTAAAAGAASPEEDKKDKSPAEKKEGGEDRGEERGKKEGPRFQRWKQLQRLPQEWESFDFLADAWYSEQKKKGESQERKLIPLSYVESMGKTKGILERLYKSHSQWKARMRTALSQDGGGKGKTSSDSEEETKEDQGKAMQVFMQGFYMALWNHQENLYGKYFSTLLGDIRTKEGLNFYDTRCMYFLDVPGTLSLFYQASRRVLRSCGMPGYESAAQWWAKIFVLIEVQTDQTVKTLDVKRWEKLQQVEKSPAELLFDLMQRNAIDCSLFAEYNYGLTSTLSPGGGLGLGGSVAGSGAGAGTGAGAAGGGLEPGEAILQTKCPLTYSLLDKKLSEALQKDAGSRVLSLVSCGSAGGSGGSGGSSIRLYWQDKQKNLLASSTSPESDPLSEVPCLGERFEAPVNIRPYNEDDEMVLQFAAAWKREMSYSPSFPSSSSLPPSGAFNTTAAAVVGGEQSPEEGGEAKEAKAVAVAYTSSSPQWNSFIDYLILDKQDQMAKESKDKIEVQSLNVVKNLLGSVEQPKSPEILFQSVNLLLPAHLEQLLRLLAVKKKYFRDQQVVSPEELRVYEEGAEPRVQAFFQKLRVLVLHGKAKQILKFLPKLPGDDKQDAPAPEIVTTIDPKDRDLVQNPEITEIFQPVPME